MDGVGCYSTRFSRLLLFLESHRLCKYQSSGNPLMSSVSCPLISGLAPFSSAPRCQAGSMGVSRNADVHQTPTLNLFFVPCALIQVDSPQVPTCGERTTKVLKSSSADSLFAATLAIDVSPKRPKKPFYSCMGMLLAPGAICWMQSHEHVVTTNRLSD